MIQTSNNLYNKMSEYTEYRDKPLKKRCLDFLHPDMLSLNKNTLYITESIGNILWNWI